MKHRVLVLVGCAAAIAFAQPITYLAQESGRAADILALARKAIGGDAKKIDALKTFSVQSSVQRNIGGMQLDSDVEIYLELPDKYARVENTSGGPGMVIAGGGTTGFNGDRPLQKAAGGAMPGGSMVIRMGSGGSFSNGATEKLTPEQLEQMNKTMLRSSKIEASRLMLGWLAMAHPAAQADYTFAGEAESIEGKAYVIDVKNADGFAARLFIDEQTNLPLMVSYKAPQPRIVNSTMSASSGGGHASKDDIDKKVQELQREEPVMADYALYFEDWRDAEGVKFPFKMRRAMAGTTTEEWTVSKVKVNPKIDAKKFTVDSGS